MSFDYKQSKQNIINIINSKTKISVENKIPEDDSKFTENGMKSWITVIFINIKDASKLFKNYDEEIVTRIMRAFCSEIISLLSTNNNYRQIDIRGGSVYGIYSTATKNEIHAIFMLACQINTFLRMFSSILEKYIEFEAGIGLSCSEELIVKAGKKKTGINDMIWIGDAVKDASNLASKANHDGIGGIVLSNIFYHNLKEYLTSIKDDTINWIKYAHQDDFYHGNMVIRDVNDWINNGMR